MKEEVKRIMKLVQEGKLSPEDAADLIDAFASGDGVTEPEPEPVGAAADSSGSASPPPPPKDKEPIVIDPFKSFVDAMEKLGKEIKDVNWNDVAKQVREGAAKGVESIKTGVDKLREGKWGWGGQETREISLPLAVPEGKTLRIENGSGDIKIVHSDTLSSVRATAKFRGHDDFEARDKADQYTLIIEESDHVVLLRQPDVSGLSVDLFIELSTKTPISIQTQSGNVSVSDIGSSCKVICRSGDVSLRGMDGSIDVNLMDGDLMIEDSKAPGITVETKSGDLVLRRVNGSVNVRTANGDVSVLDSSCKTVSLESVSGDISLFLREPVSGTVNVRTVNGDASLQVPSTSDCRVTLSTLRGTVGLNGDLAEESRAEQRITGKIGEGTGAIDVSAVNGDVTLTLRDHASPE